MRVVWSTIDDRVDLGRTLNFLNRRGKHMFSPGAREPFFNRGFKVKNQVLSCNMMR